jgi:hypothetical protein
VERCRFRLARSNLSRWFGRVFNQLAASTSSPATCEEDVGPALLERFSDNGGLSGDTRAEKEGKVVSVGRPAVVAVLVVLEDAF